MVAVLALLGAVDDEAVPAELRRRARDGSKWTRQRAMEKLAARDLTMVLAFARKGTNPELYKIAKAILGKSGAIPKPKMRLKG